MNKSLLLSLLVAVLCVASIQAVAGTYYTTFVYTRFISSDTYSEDLGEDYTSITVLVTNKLGYNQTTGSGEARFILANTTEATKEGVAVFMKEQGTADGLLVYWKQGASDFEVGKTTWDTDDLVKITVSNSLLQVELYDNSTGEWSNVIDEYGVGSATFRAVCALASTEFVCDTGYMNVKVGSSFGSAGIGDAITEWLPIIVQFAMLGMVMGMIKKFR